MTIYRIIGYEYPEYNDNVPTPIPPLELLESNLLNPNSKIRDLLNEYKIGYLEFLFIRRFALKTGAELPEELKEKIIKKTEWDNEKDWWKYASKDFKEMRKNSHKDF